MHSVVSTVRCRKRVFRVSLAIYQGFRHIREAINLCQVHQWFSELMLFEGIQMTFTDLSGLERRPMARTCNTLLQLLSMYQSFPEMREEFNHILMAYSNWVMDMM